MATDAMYRNLKCRKCHANTQRKLMRRKDGIEGYGDCIHCGTPYKPADVMGRRKNPRCDECGKRISKGTAYWRGTKNGFRLCPECFIKHLTCSVCGEPIADVGTCHYTESDGVVCWRCVDGIYD